MYSILLPHTDQPPLEPLLVGRSDALLFDTGPSLRTKEGYSSYCVSSFQAIKMIPNIGVETSLRAGLLFVIPKNTIFVPSEKGMVDMSFEVYLPQDELRGDSRFQLVHFHPIPLVENLILSELVH